MTPRACGPGPALPNVSQGRREARGNAGGFRVEIGHHRPGGAYPMHSHREANVLYVLAGGFGQTVDGRTLAGTSGTAIAKPGGVPHSDRFGPSPTVLLYIEAVGSRLDQVRQELGFLGDIACRSAQAARPAALRLAAALRSPASPTLLTEALALELLVELSAPPVRSTSATARCQAGRAAELLEETLAAPPGLDSVAAEVGLPVRRLLVAFRHRFAESPGEYVRRRRLERAAERLAAGRDELAVIAAELGFADQAHLTRAFRAVYGDPPGRYRRRLRLEGDDVQDAAGHS